MNKEQTITGVIRGTGACVPERVLDNNEIAGFVDTSDEWIRERTGVERRRIVEKETTVSMAAEAGRQALEEAGVSPEEVDMILVERVQLTGFFHAQPVRYRKYLEPSGQSDLTSMLRAADFFLLTILPRRIFHPESVGRSWSLEVRAFLVWWTGRIVEPASCLGMEPERFF